MKKVLFVLYRALLFIFFVSYFLLIRSYATEHPIFYGIALILGGVFVSVVAFLLNHSKKVMVRRFYLLSMIGFSVFMLFEGLDFMLVNVIAGNEILINVRRYLIAISIAITATALLFSIFYTIKDYFKKGYALEKFDFEAIMMDLTIIAMLLLVYLNYDIAAPRIIERNLYNGSQYIKTVYSYSLNTPTNIMIWSLIISGIYLVLYALIEIIKYQLFDKEKHN